MRKVSKAQKPMHMKYPHHVDMMAKGGVVKRKNFDGGGLASSISGALGTKNDFSAGAANITPGTNAGQISDAYTGVTSSLNNQNQLTGALLPQAQQGVNNQNFLANQYTQMAQGQGPNPAQAALNQNTGTNIAQQAALMAGQRGAGVNPGLIAMQAAQQGANTQQQAVGQGATLQAQQQVAAQNNLANLSSNQINQAGTAVTGQNTAQQNEQNALLNTNNAYNNTNVAQQSGINSVNAGVAAGNQQTNTGILGGAMGAIGSLAGPAGKVLGSFGLAHGGEVHPHMMTDGGLAAAPVNVQPGGWGGQYTMPGAAQAPAITAAPQQANQSNVLANAMAAGKDAMKRPEAEMPGAQEQAYFSGQMDQAQQNDMEPATPMNDPSQQVYAHGGMINHHQLVHNYFSGGSTGADVPAIVSPKEVYLSPDKVKKVLHEGADPMRIGHHFPGKDKVKGKDSRKNDVIPTTLQDGGVVLPLHITQHKKASELGRKFVEKAIAKHMKNPRK